jgi:hypothetical protein
MPANRGTKRLGVQKQPWRELTVGEAWGGNGVRKFSKNEITKAAAKADMQYLKKQRLSASKKTKRK